MDRERYKEIVEMPHEEFKELSEEEKEEYRKWFKASQLMIKGAAHSRSEAM